VPLCKAYRVTKVWGDNFAGEFAKEPFRKAGVFYDLWPQHKSEIYRDALLPLINSKLIKLPRTGVGGKIGYFFGVCVESGCLLQDKRVGACSFHRFEGVADLLGAHFGITSRTQSMMI